MHGIYVQLVKGSDGGELVLAVFVRKLLHLVLLPVWEVPGVGSVGIEEGLDLSNDLIVSGYSGRR